MTKLLPSDVSAELLIKVLLKQQRHDLLYDLARAFADLKLAGPWCGPFVTTTPGRWDPSTKAIENHTLEQWVRPIPDPRGPASAAIIFKDGNSFEWFAIPRSVDAFDPVDRKKGTFQYTGKEVPSLAEAQRRADRILLEDAYVLDGRTPTLGPWTLRDSKTGAYRAFLGPSLRDSDSPLGDRALIIQQQPTSQHDSGWTWAVLHPHASDKANAIAAQGSSPHASAARMAADIAARELGWDVPP